MNRITNKEFKEKIKQICREANYFLNDDLVLLLKRFRDRENEEVARDILDTILENADQASVTGRPLCQDTGVGIFIVEIGESVSFHCAGLSDIIAEAMAETYREESFRKSTVSDPLFSRNNSGDNLPPLIHWEVVPGDKLRITFLPKGAGAENMSRIKMFKPLVGKDEIIDFILDTVRIADGNPCPPLIIGLGIGGSFDYAPLLAKRALLKPLLERHPDPEWASLEEKILERVNKLGIGPMGLGGNTTALKVSILEHPCHTASLPVAVNLQCHSHRYKTITI